MKVLVLICGLAVCALAQETQPAEGEQVPPIMDPTQNDAALFMHVQQEEMVARRWLEVILKLSHAQYNSMATMMIMHVSQMEAQELAEYDGTPGVDISDDDEDLEEATQDSGDDEDFDLALLEKSNGLTPMYGDMYSAYGGMDNVESNENQDKLQLFAHYYFYYAIKTRWFQTIYRAGDVQREFWMDRVMQLSVAAGGQQLPPQIYQLLYFKVFRTYLETMKLSMVLQMVSNWVMWLEDGLDVFGAKVDPENVLSDVVVVDQEDDLIRDRMWAFSAYNQFAFLDFMVFYLDLYLEATLGPMLGFGSLAGSPGPSFGAAPPPAEEPPAANANVAMLEESAEPAEPNKSQFYSPHLANPLIWLKFFKWYHLMFQMQAAHMANTAAQTEQLSYTKIHDGDAEESANYRRFSQQAYSGFAMSLYYASQIEQWLAFFEIFAMVAPVMAGSFGGQGSFQGGSI